MSVREYLEKLYYCLLSENANKAIEILELILYDVNPQQNSEVAK